MKSPFKFLDSYTKDDREIFFGRDREIEELYQKVFDSKLLLVYGVSGTGKSSLIHCGLANKFLETDWLPLVIRRGGNIIESMASGIKGAAITQQDNNFHTPADFKKGVKSLYLDHYKPVFFIFDQFEELFIFGGKEERREFVHIVKTLIESDLQCRFIFVMREEYMAWITEFEKVIPTFFANRVRIEKMSHRNALDTIKEPCKIFNINLEEGFAETLLEKLSPGSTEVELTFLQVYLDKIFRLTQSEKTAVDNIEHITFTLPLLQKTGNVSDLLGSFLDEQIALMENPDIAMTVLKAFVSGKGTKRPANEAETIDNVRSLGKEISAQLVTELLQNFVNLRVLRDKDDNGRYELRHDALAEKIFEKFSLAEKELLEIRQLIENAYQYYLKRKILLNNDDLIYISDKDSILNLNSELQEFINESRKHHIAKIRTVRRLTAISFVSFLIMMGILSYYIITKISQTKADYEAIRISASNSDQVKELKMASELWKKYPGAIQKEALLKAFNKILEYPGTDTLMLSISARYNIVFDPAPVKIQYADCSNDNKYIFGYSDSLIFLWNLQGKLENIITTEHFPIIDIKISYNSQYIGTVSKDSLLTIWDINGKKQFQKKIHYNNLNTRQIFKFTRKNSLVSLSIDCDAIVLDSDGTVMQTLSKHKGRVNAVDISSDNNFIGTASVDKTIIIWYYNSTKNRYEYYNTLTQHSDTVWSVSFSRDGVNVVSTSSDCEIFITNINNNKIYQNGLGYKYEKLISSYAEFTASDKGIVAISHSYNNSRLNNMYYGYNWYNPKKSLNNREGADMWYVSSKFSKLSFSPDENYYASSENDNVYLVDNKLSIEKDKLNIKSTFTLMEFKGKNPFFSKNNQYFMFTNGEKIRICYLDIDTICELSSNISE